MKVELVWTTPDGDNLIARLARVSNTDNQDNKETASKLLKYLINHNHWSPFEMAHACVEIETTRDIGRQILRHRSFSFQEFSQRYAKTEEEAEFAEARLQDVKNRQNSIAVEDIGLEDFWTEIQQISWKEQYERYNKMLGAGIAKELARKLLPEGLVKTRMYMVGSMRSWIHYWSIRCDNSTQKEHRDVANATKSIILEAYPGLRELLIGEK